MEKVRVGLSVRNVVFLPFYYAQHRRIYQKHGLEVELIQMRSDLQTVGVASGEIDYYPAIGPAILAVQGGMPLRAVVVFYRAPLFSLVSQSQLGSPKELEGKKVAVSRIGSDSHRYAVLMLERSGVDAKKVTFIQTGNTAVSLTALQQVSVEAYEEIRGVILANLMMPENRLQEYLEGAHRRGELNRMLQVNEVFDYSLLKEVQ